MTERVKINSSTFRVLKKNSTANIDTAADSELAFDGMASTPYPGIILQGTSKTSDWAPAVATSPPSINGYYNPYQTYRRSAVIGFTTQSVAPDILFMIRPIGTTDWATPQYSYLNEFGSISPSSPSFETINGTNYYFYMLNSWAGTSVWASTTTNSLILRVDYVQNSSGNLDWEFSFLVFQYFNVPKLYDASGNIVG